MSGSATGRIVQALVARLNRGPQQANDASTLQALRADNGAALGLPPGLSLRWLGTSGFALSYAGTTLLIDPYVSRHGLADVLRRRRALLADDACVRRHVPRADAVLVGHTHFDHALDVPAIARRDGARVYGSRSLVQLMTLYGLQDRAVAITTGRVMAIGPFEVTFVPSLHSKLVAGLAVPSDGELTCDHLDSLHAGAYRCGQTYGIHIAVAGVTLYHQGSANLIDDAVMHRGVDVFLAGIAGRRFTTRYAQRILSRLEPKLVVPHHFDDFFRPLDQPLGFSLNVNLGGFVEEVERVSTDFRVRTLLPTGR